MTCYVLATLILAITSGNVFANATDGIVQVEVFTTTDLNVVDEVESNTKQYSSDIDLQVYRLDGIQKIEAILSENLPSDPESARRAVLERIELNGRSTATMQRAAIGLAKAIQYGINRYPAVVFNSEAVVYGVTNLKVALDQYWAWQTGANQ